MTTDNKYVFRMHDRGTTGSGWFDSEKFSSKELQKVQTDFSKVPTSIPSPYAQIDLVKTAFKWIVNTCENGKKCDFEGKENPTAYHRLVSYAFDVAELFFYIEKHQNNFKIVSWNPNERFRSYEEEDYYPEKHRKLFKTLKLYWEQDKNEGNNILYNFDKTDKLFFILNKYNQVIGGTSPITLFFAAPDAEENMKETNIIIGTHRLFSTEYKSLAQRDHSFIKYMYALQKVEGFKHQFKEINSYLNAISKELTQDLREEVNNINVEEYFNPNSSDIEELTVSNLSNQPVDVIGYKLYKKRKTANVAIKDQSDFVIKPDYDFDTDVLLPLILPNDKFSKKWTYTTSGVLWQENYEIPAKNTDLSDKATLPVLHDMYPWRSVDNFLEDKIFRLPYHIDENTFVTAGSDRFLLPLTTEFFKYFKPENVKKYVSIEELSGGGVNVKLKIPVKGSRFVQFEKYYAVDDILDHTRIHLAIIPFIKVKDINLDYSVALIDDTDSRSENISLNFFSKGSIISDLKPPVNRSQGSNEVQLIVYKIKKKKFDAIQFNLEGHSGFIIPKFPKANTGSEVKFAVDFGTTNTHIEYMTEGRNATAFDNTGEIWKSLAAKSGPNAKDRSLIENEEFFDRSLIPYLIGNEDVAFPLRTALMWNKGLNDRENIEIFQHSNNYLLWGQKPKDRFVDVFTDIKWDGNRLSKTNAYIKYLVHIMYYKTLLLGGDLKKTKIIWFYPVSMGNTQRGNIFEAWEKAFIEIFGIQDVKRNLIGYPESIGPYFVYKSKISGMSLSIDIGGGSADIAVFDETHSYEPHFVSSLRFAGNAIHGDGYDNDEYGMSMDANGFVKAYYPEAASVVKLLGENKRMIFDDLMQNAKRSKEFINFLYQLEKEKEVNFSFSKLLYNNDRYKLNHFIYFAAVIYYSVTIMKNKGLEYPKNILLSGMASNSIRILDLTPEFSVMQKMAKFIISKVYNEEINARITIEKAKNPKVITAKGGIQSKIESIEPKVMFWIGNDKDKIVNRNEATGLPYYDDLINNNEILKNIADNVKAFFEILDQFVDSIRLNEMFNISMSAYKIFKDIREDHLVDDIKKGIIGFNNKMDEKVGDSLFFYPLIGILNRLPMELYKNKE